MASPNKAGYDVIGDIHGHANKLIALLARMDYRVVDGVWRHPTRTAVFVGDLIDRGPGQLETVSIVRSMVERGGAKMVLGNHEFNAIAWHTPDPDLPGSRLRPHNKKNRAQHRAFLAEVEGDPATQRLVIDWFMTVPLWLDLGGLRVVHACWDDHAIDVLGEMVGPGKTLTPELVVAASRRDSALYNAIEHLLKGPEVDVPVAFCVPGGHKQPRARFRWWLPGPYSLNTHADIPPGSVTPDGDPYPDLPTDPIPAPVKVDLSTAPVIYGHYWKSGTLDITGDMSACVDYSAGNGGPLVAYRWSGETTLTSDHLVASDR